MKKYLILTSFMLAVCVHGGEFIYRVGNFPAMFNQDYSQFQFGLKAEVLNYITQNLEKLSLGISDEEVAHKLTHILEERQRKLGQQRKERKSEGILEDSHCGTNYSSNEEKINKFIDYATATNPDFLRTMWNPSIIDNIFSVDKIVQEVLYQDNNYFDDIDIFLNNQALKKSSLGNLIVRLILKELPAQIFTRESLHEKLIYVEYACAWYNSGHFGFDEYSLRIKRCIAGLEKLMTP